MGDFKKCLAVVLKWEGGNDDDKDDPGGRTSRGIIQREYDKFRDSRGQPHGDVWKANNAEIAAIYYANYWQRVRGDELDDGVALTLFDCAVNNGVGQCAKWAQRALGPRYSGAVDGDFGPATFAGLKAIADNDAFIADVLERRDEFYRYLAGKRVASKKFLRGWLNRNSDIRAIAQAWATGSVGPEPHPLAGAVAVPKAKPGDIPAQKLDASVGNTVAAVGGVGTAAAGAYGIVADLGKMASDAATQLQPVALVSPRVMALCSILAVVGVVIGLYATWSARRRSTILNGG